MLSCSPQESWAKGNANVDGSLGSNVRSGAGLGPPASAPRPSAEQQSRISGPRLTGPRVQHLTAAKPFDIIGSFNPPDNPVRKIQVLSPFTRENIQIQRLSNFLKVTRRTRIYMQTSDPKYRAFPV